MQKLIVVLSFIFCFESLAQSPSTYRRPGESWNSARVRAMGFSSARAGSALDEAVPVAQLDRTKAHPFKGNKDQLISNYNNVRDWRFLDDPSVANFKRRLSWMYPDDGCFMRAEWVARILNKQYHQSWVNKLFVFGDLEVKTPNHPNGVVRWWYHVVAAMAFAGQIIVFDPAIDPRQPMLLESWLALLGPPAQQLKVSICESGTFGPNEMCDKLELLDEPQLLNFSRTYLAAERSRLVSMGRDADKELGEAPPWKRRFTE